MKEDSACPGNMPICLNKEEAKNYVYLNPIASKRCGHFFRSSDFTLARAR